VRILGDADLTSLEPRVRFAH